MTNNENDIIYQYSNIPYIKFIKHFQLSSLENLCVDAIKIGSDHGLVLIPINKCNIKSICINITCRLGVTIGQINHTLLFTLQSCPHLNMFTLSSYLKAYTSGIMVLQFFNHNQSKSFHINIKGIYYYTIPWYDGKQGIQWTDFINQLQVVDSTGNNFHIDLAWKSKHAIILDLATVPQ